VTLLAAGFAGIAVWLLVRPSRPRRQASPPSVRRIRATRTVVIRLSCVGLGAAFALIFGGVIGAVIGGALALVGPRLLAGLESRSERQRRMDLERQIPAAADLLAACLTAGAAPGDAARAVGRALGEPIATPLARLTGALDLGADPAGAWRALGSEASLRPIARAASRSLETGAPLAGLLVAVADDQRDEARSRADAAARAAGVRSVAPLVACFLPAFILIGIVPVVASLALPLLA
jgi:Flp pilus assembly protein TadB